MYAAISPRDCAVGLLREADGDVQLLDNFGVPVGLISAERYLSRHPDAMILEVRDGKQAVDLLAEQSAMSMCLDMTLLLFDRDVSLQTRHELATELDRLFQDIQNRNYVLDVVLCGPLPPTSDTDGVVKIVESTNLTREVVASIIGCQDRVRLVQESWLLVKQETIVGQAGEDRVFALFSRHGIFRRLAVEATNRSTLNAIRSSLAMSTDLKDELDSAPRIVLSLVKELSEKLPVGSNGQSAVPKYAEIVSCETETEFEEIGFAKPQHSSTHAAFNAAVSQVERIATLFTQAKDVQAQAILDELIEHQTKSRGVEKYLVKSLCNIATKVSISGRPEIGLGLLMKALEYPSGIDYKLYFQIGNELRELRQFDKAEKCYEQAIQLNRGLPSDDIQLAMIRMRVAKGDYEEALSDFLAIPDLRDRPIELSALGKLYRKMGSPRQAREAYEDCIKVDSECHSAYAGLAEVRKQIGKPHRAIAGYNSLIRRFTELDVGSKKVYDLARSQLFRLTKQYDKSEQILRGLTTAFPADRSVHLQFAKLLVLRGDDKQAKEHFEKANGASLRDLGALVFAKVCKTFNSTLIRDGLASIQASIMPEDKGLASCLEAYDLITNSDFERAQQVLCVPSFVDRQVDDFSKVLRFHALRKVSNDFDYKSDHFLCRVAKRSDRSLREAMYSIACSDYVEAERLETEYLLRLVA